MPKYRFVTSIEFEAADDIEARRKAVVLLCRRVPPPEAGMKLQELHGDKPPVGISLKLPDWLGKARSSGDVVDVPRKLKDEEST